MTQGRTHNITKILFDDWDPIGVGPYEKASEMGINDEYDEVVWSIMRSTDHSEMGIDAVLRRFESEIGLQGNSVARINAAKKIGALL